MYNNPYMQYNPIPNIDRQIEELQNMKARYTQPQVTNVINTQNTSSSDFEARYLNENEKVDEIIIQKRTAFISIKNKELTIKEINGDITTYGLIIPKDEKDIKIENLENKIKELEAKINVQQSDTATINEVKESKTSDSKSSGK